MCSVATWIVPLLSAVRVVAVPVAGFGFGSAGLRAAAEPFHLYADAVAQALLGALLPLDVGLSLFEEFGIAAFYAQQAFGVNAVELDDLGGDVLQEVSVVSDDDEGKTGSTEQAFQPFDAVKVEVVGGLVEEKHLRIGDKGFGDGESLAPAAAQARGFTVHAWITGSATAGSVDFSKAGPAQRFAQPLLAGGSRNRGTFECGLNDQADRDSGSEV